MKLVYRFLLAFIPFLSFPWLVQAQHSTFVGSAAEVAATFREKMLDKEMNSRVADLQIRHQVNGRKPLILNLTSGKTEAGREKYFGKVEGEPNSGFYLEIAGNEVSGSIILRNSRKYYAYSSINGLVYLAEENIDKKLCVNFQEAAQKSTSASKLGTKPVASVPMLESLPGAGAVVLLDFDGQTVSGTLWNDHFNSGNPIVAAPANLSNTEIQEVWKMISEDFRPFNLNVTTSEAVFNNAPANRRVRAIFSPTNYFFPNAGGVAYVGSFIWGNTSSGETPCWIFNTTSKFAGEAGTHEIGHTMHLLHDGTTTPAEEYYYGHPDWAPIMGVGYYRSLVQWSKGEYLNANRTEDDLNLLTTMNGFSYRPDDHGDAAGTATPLILGSSGTISATANKGIIATQTDVDVFSFNLTGAPISVTVNPDPLYPNLDVALTLRNAANAVVASADPSTMEATLSGTFPAGTYYLYIDGALGAMGANSDYGSLGAYFISGSLSNQAPVVSLTSPVSSATFIAPATITLEAAASDPDGTISKVEFYNGATKLGEDLSAPYTFAWSGVASGTYNLTAKAIDNLNAVSTSAMVTVLVAPNATQYNLNITVVGNGSVTRSPSQVSYLNGTNVTLTATGATGYRFSGWSGDASGSTNPLTLVMNSNKNITATFTPIPTVTKFNLIDATTEKVIRQITSGETLNLATLPSRKLNIQVETSPTTVGSVKMVLSGAQTKTSTDSYKPYSVFGDDKRGNYYSWTPTLGNYTLTATPYSGSNAGGQAGTAQTITFKVVDDPKLVSYDLFITVVGSGSVIKSPSQNTYTGGTVVSLTATPVNGYKFSGWSGSVTSTSNPLSLTMTSSKSITATFTPVLAVTGFNLINASTEQVIQPLSAGAVLNLAKLPTRKLNIQAVTVPATTGSVVMVLSGTQTKNFTDSYAPYAVFGDDRNGNYYAWTPSMGNYSLTATPYSAGNGTGNIGAPLTINFSVIDQAIISSAEEGKTLPEQASVEPLVAAYPNPFRNELKVKINSKISEPAVLTMLDIAGKVLYQRRLEPAVDNYILPAEIINYLASGVYLLRLQQGSQQQVVRVTRE
ncbi:InlB B-repeat-containing protein [Adhaeribacter soli]|uniref:T9SS type A sorting domain-containing protein n=1 Tax=Adhaeribacter soli TaxID=2607655 RepID=A0A5N1IXM9_9BACT|nr:Ig-like domain-containing protein [Adhaeribacter soli]KAA9339021.1 T9SS type A sorting domain-containing protein [Adhaeribacter soli]